MNILVYADDMVLIAASVREMDILYSMWVFLPQRVIDHSSKEKEEYIKVETFLGRKNLYFMEF